MKTIVEKHRVGAKVTVESLTFQKGLNFYSLRFYPTHFLLDPCDIRHVGRRDNAIYLLWEMKSIVMQKYFIVLSSNTMSQGLL